MKLKKEIVLTFLITAVIFSGIAVTAVTLTAKEIGFTSTHENWKVDNVNDAMNDLYELGIAASNVKVYKLGEGRNVGKYAKDNFIVADSGNLGGSVTLAADGSSDSSKMNITATLSKISNFSVSYDNTTGKLTITGGAYQLKNHQTYYGHMYSSNNYDSVPVVYFVSGVEISTAN